MAVHFSTARWACLAAHIDGGEVGVLVGALQNWTRWAWHYSTAARWALSLAYFSAALGGAFFGSEVGTLGGALVDGGEVGVVRGALFGGVATHLTSAQRARLAVEFSATRWARLAARSSVPTSACFAAHSSA